MHEPRSKGRVFLHAERQSVRSVRRNRRDVHGPLEAAYEAATGTEGAAVIVGSIISKRAPPFSPDAADSLPLC